MTEDTPTGARTEVKAPNGEPDKDVAARPVWRIALDLNLERGYAGEADVMQAYAAVAEDRSNADLRELYAKTLRVYQQRQGQIEDLFIADKYDRQDWWAVIRSVRRRPDRVPLLSRFPFFRSSTIDTFFAVEAAQPPDVGAAFADLNDLAVKSAQVLRGTDQVSFNTELAVAFENLIGQVADAKGGPLPDEQVKFLQGEVVRLNDLWKTAAARGIPITTLEGMGIGTACVVLVGVIIGLLLRQADIADLRFSTFVAVVVAGALGAIISVLVRMSMGSFKVPLDTARTNVRLLGGIRPMIGATFAVIIVFGLIGQLLGVQTVVDDPHRFYAYVVFAFLAGFSERWAQNLLSGVASSLGEGAGPTTADPHRSQDGG